MTTQTKEGGMAAVETRSLGQIADTTSGTDLRAEYEEITARIDTALPLSTMHAYAVLAAVAIARVAVLEMGR